MRDETIDEATLIAWIDGQLDESRSTEVAAAVTADPELAKLADTHRRMKTRFASAFGPIGDVPVTMPRGEPAAVISMAAARAAREARTRAEKKVAKKPPRWMIPGAIAASLIVGFLFLQPVAMPSGPSGGISDKANALALSKPIAEALDGQLSGKVGNIRVALSFRAKDGQYCRSFAATHLAGIACRTGDSWQLRYAGPADAAGNADYRQAGDDAAQGSVISAMIAGEPLDATAEAKARDAHWK